jgi:alpha-beta hydrolase superfamily lysophospholipase
MITSHKNLIVNGSGDKPMLVDLCFENELPSNALVIYSHGFNGFKDWGNFDLIAHQFAVAGFTFIKFNFSHNGTTVDHPEEFADLEAFGNNNYTKQLEDLEAIINWSQSGANNLIPSNGEREIYLLGHSMGGGIVLLKAAEDPPVKKVATWASISECKTPWGKWSKERMNEWKETGVAYYNNGRTGQQMPLYYQLYEDYVANEERLNIRRAISQINIPVLLCHGINDEAVLLETAQELKSAQPNAELFVVDSDHVFGRKHPWTSIQLPEPMQLVVDRTIQFFKSG